MLPTLLLHSLGAVLLGSLPAGLGAQKSDAPNKAADASWWAYGPLQAQEPLAQHEDDGPAHPVDRYIDAGLRDAGLEPAARAEPEALLRRATFGLTGLPPTAEERAAFLGAVESLGWDAAWSALLDRLFASPHYGEAWARHWLDLVRYAETDGYERDSQKRNIWRYRDWVVRALNDDMPYDQFVQWQLAGDEYAVDLNDPFEAASANIATGFYRIGLYDDEPADRLQAASDDRADIVDTVSQVVFGTTMGCARCHDHKADPITQREYFALTAHFRGVTRYEKGGLRPFADRPAEGVWLPEEHAKRLAEIERDLGAEADRLGVGRAFEVPNPKTFIPSAKEGGHAWRYRFGAEPFTDAWSSTGFDDSQWEEGRSGFGTHGTPGAEISTVWNQPLIQLRTTFRLESIPDSSQLSIHHDDEIRVYLNGQLIFEREGYAVKYSAYQLDAKALAALVVGRNVLAVECSQVSGGQFVDVGLNERWDLAAEGGLLDAVVRALGVEASGKDPFTRLRELFVLRERHLAEPTASPYPAHVAFEHGAVPPAQFVELRGSAHARGDEVEPALPTAWTVGSSQPTESYSILAPREDAASSHRRRTLADWAFAGGQHITARVAANRAWQLLFGRGLCRSSGDFGRLGEPPTHLELLDATAWELIQRGWSIKSLQRWLMESRAYQASTERSAQADREDPRNDHYAGFDPRRLTAEEFRDATLAVSGELNPALFGPWVYPPLAKEVLATSSQPNNAWGQSAPEDALRRSLYVHVKRSLREPLLAIFDQPDPDLPCPVRFPTNVPTQALLTLNGPFVNARAEALASSVLAVSESGGTRDAVRHAIERALLRDAAQDEVQRGVHFIETLMAEEQLSTERAMQLFALGLFNRNEFLWID